MVIPQIANLKLITVSKIKSSKGKLEKWERNEKEKEKMGRYPINFFINLYRQDEFKIEKQDKDKCQMVMHLSLSLSYWNLPPSYIIIIAINFFITFNLKQ